MFQSCYRYRSLVASILFIKCYNNVCVDENTDSINSSCACDNQLKIISVYCTLNMLSKMAEFVFFFFHRFLIPTKSGLVKPKQYYISLQNL